jgi:hypothetical protein
MEIRICASPLGRVVAVVHHVETAMNQTTVPTTLKETAIRSRHATAAGIFAPARGVMRRATAATTPPFALRLTPATAEAMPVHRVPARKQPIVAESPRPAMPIPVIVEATRVLQKLART